jgi:dipeptidyl aminopeptidase/acylaminoacyl peptidase
MKTLISPSFRSGLTRRTRIVLIALAAALPLSLFAQQAGQSGAAKSLLSPGTAVAIPFSGEGWQDKVLQHEGYVMPPPELAAAVLAPREMNVTLSNPSPDKKWFLDEIGDGPTPMSIFGKPFDELGGTFIDYKANRLRSVTLRNTIGLQLISAADGSRKTVATPANTRVTNARWTEDGSGVMYLTLGDDSTHIWVTDLATNKPRQITKTSLLTTFVTSFSLINNGKTIVAVFPPDGRTPRPLPPPIPAGPEIKVAMDNDSSHRLRTFPSLMTTPYDFQLLEWHATGQIALVDVATGAMTKFGTPGMITAVDMNPNGKYARVTRMTKPFSYIVPTSSFGSIEEVWDATGKALTKLNDRPINLGARPDTNPDPVDPTNPQPAPQGGGAANDNGKREITWRTDGNGFNFLQLEPLTPAQAQAAARAAAAGGGRAGGGGAGGGGGRGNAPAQADQGPPRKDRLFSWAPPFGDADAKQIYEHPTRMTGVRFSTDGKIMFFSADNATKAIYLDDMTKVYDVIPATTGRGGNRGDAAGNAPATSPPPSPSPAPQNARGGGAGAGGGATLLGVGGGGGGGGRAGGGGGGGGRGGGGGPTTPVLLSSDGTSVFIQRTQGGGGGGRGGANANPNAPPPVTIIEKVDIKSGTRTVVYQSTPVQGMNETVSVLDPEAKKMLITRQNATTPPQQFMYDNGNVKQLTNNEDLFPDLTRMVIQRYEITRADGFKFRTIVYLPADYKEGTRLPGFFWFYPYEYTSQDNFDNATNGGGDPNFSLTAPNTFRNFTSSTKQFLTRLGYAVIENQAPIVGAQGQMNNNYVNDLRNDLSATIDELDRRQIIDRTRLAIGGHSYGAFSTVNAMVNTPYFKAGIAGDGAYNRTLTPMGFQNEQRLLWDAPNVYLDMSPFLRANQITGALLMYHGMHDQNVGTDPINSIRLFHALNDLGKTVALYRYPFEDHGPAARETLLDLWARWAAWLDKYVKNPAPPNKPAATPSSGRGGGL